MRIVPQVATAMHAVFGKSLDELAKSTGCWKRCRDGVVAEAPDCGFPAPSGAALFLEPGAAFALDGRGDHAPGGAAAGPPDPQQCVERRSSSRLLPPGGRLAAAAIGPGLGGSSPRAFGDFRAGGDGGRRPAVGQPTVGTRANLVSGAVDALPLPVAVRPHVPFLQLATAGGHSRRRVHLAFHGKQIVEDRRGPDGLADGGPIYALRAGLGAAGRSVGRQARAVL